MTSRDITEAAGQRNTSAISYHFGSREGLLRALLARRGEPIDEARGVARATFGMQLQVPDLVECLVLPYCSSLTTAGGRSYLRIVAQLRGTFAAWRVQSDAGTTQHLAQILEELESRAKGEAAIRRERIVALIMLLTALTAERARNIDEEVPLGLSHEVFLTQLVEMCSVLIAPATEE